MITRLCINCANWVWFQQVIFGSSGFISDWRGSSITKQIKKVTFDSHRWLCSHNKLEGLHCSHKSNLFHHRNWMGRLSYRFKGNPVDNVGQYHGDGHVISITCVKKLLVHLHHFENHLFILFKETARRNKNLKLKKRYNLTKLPQSGFTDTPLFRFDGQLEEAWRKKNTSSK